MSIAPKAAGLLRIRKKKTAVESFPLYQAPGQILLKVVQIRADDDLCARITTMGIRLGSLITVRRIGSSSSCLARVNGSRHIISLCGQITRKIWVVRK
jgi:Fe2+ transport system protein FeoA